MKNSLHLQNVATRLSSLSSLGFFLTGITQKAIFMLKRSTIGGVGTVENNIWRDQILAHRVTRMGTPQSYMGCGHYVHRIWRGYGIILLFYYVYQKFPSTPGWYIIWNLYHSNHLPMKCLCKTMLYMLSIHCSHQNICTRARTRCKVLWV